jgi:hypothetical protein
LLKKWFESLPKIFGTNTNWRRPGNDILFGNIEAFGDVFERAQRHTKELSRINVDNAKTIANTAKETAAE